jgi:hypothetical protein
VVKNFRPFENIKNPDRMKSKSFTTMGAMHPVLFFAGVYIVALLFSIFICSSLFYSCNTNSIKLAKEQKAPAKNPAEQGGTTTLAMK